MRSLLLLAALACTAAPLAAQERLDSGTVVRVRPGVGARWHTGRLRGVAGDTLWVASLGAPPGRQGRAVVAPRESARIEVSDDYDAISRRRHWLIGGAGVVFALTALATRDSEAAFDPGPVGTAAFGFVSGVVVGVVGAEALYPRRWHPVQR